MRLFAYDGGLGAVGVRRTLVVFVIKGGKVGGLDGVAEAGAFDVGDIGGGDAVFVLEDKGAIDGDTSVAIMPVGSCKYSGKGKKQR